MAAGSCGLTAGRLIIRRSRQRSASLILAGNRTVLEDIGLQTARFVDWLVQSAPGAPVVLADFLAELLAGPANQELLRQAFTHYFEARMATGAAEKQRATYLGNCFAVWHKHVRLEPYIQGAMPLIIRRCVTQRLLQFDIGALRLAVAQDVPVPAVLAEAAASRNVPTVNLLRSVSGNVVDGAASFAGTAARDWTRIKERMRYVFALFHAFHTEPQVCLAPYAADQLAAIEAGHYPAGAWR